MNFASILILAVFCYGVIKFFSDRPSFTDSSIVRSEEYVSRLQSIHSGTISANPLRLRGWEGEMQTLFLIEAVGKGITYWNVGVRFHYRKSEYDIIVLCPYGVLHVEVKAYSGTYSPAEGQPSTNPNDWKKINRFTGEIKESWSPVSQALRAKEILSDVLKTVCDKDIPVETVVVFSDSSFQASGIEDTRLPWLDAKNFQNFYKAFVLGQIANGAGLDLLDMAKIATCLGQGGFEPVFYDADLLRRKDD